MRITVGGVVIQEQPFSLSTKFDEAVKETERLIESKNRSIRRSKPMKVVMGVLGTIGALGYATVARAEGVEGNPLTENRGFFLQLADKVILQHSDAGFIKEQITGSVMREDSMVWKMNNWLQEMLLNTQDFFDNSQILTVFNSIWYICMSFVTVIIAKKGFDMVKSRVLGSTSLGAQELIIRLLACVVMTFFSLDIMQVAIEGSNLIISTLFKALESHLIPYSALEATNSIALVFWFIGFCFMFVVLALQYWVRQITVVILGMLTPVATMSWVVDGGAMLGTLIREFVTLITTPLVHGIVLGIGTVLMHEVTTMTGNTFIDGFNSVMIGFSTMFLMIVTPTFLRKFTTGSFNPVKWAVGTSKGVYGSAMRVAKLIKK